MSIRGIAVATSAAVAVAGLTVGLNVITARAGEPAGAAARAPVPAAASLAPATPGGERMAAIQEVAETRADKRRAAEKRRKAEQRRKAAAQAAAAQQARERASRAATRTTFSGDARGIARQIAAQKYGWGEGQFACLNSLWAKESGWNYRASNPSSGAYGIPQALPGSKMATFGSDWRTNPATQIKWGLHYIDGRYGSPCSAWSSAQSKGWY
jgi:murein DD-endopeptidase MepM/ murein hydrolase activator NlpD